MFNTITHPGTMHNDHKGINACMRSEAISMQGPIVHPGHHRTAHQSPSRSQIGCRYMRLHAVRAIVRRLSFTAVALATCRNKSATRHSSLAMSPSSKSHASFRSSHSTFHVQASTSPAILQHKHRDMMIDSVGPSCTELRTNSSYWLILSFIASMKRVHRGGGRT